MDTDRTGSTALDYGVYGIPTTFDRNGQIVKKHVGAVTPQVLEDTLQALTS
jgi:cytochrome c biogenesis protein CcmG/thiol:disulfide interchange protein DsbE